MKGEPRIYVMCDLCEEDYDFGLTPLAGGGWDDRGLDSRLRSDGWSVDGDHHVCPDCVEERQANG